MKKIVLLMVVVMLFGLFGCCNKKDNMLDGDGVINTYDFSNIKEDVQGWWKTDDHPNYLLYIDEENVEIWFLNRKTDSVSYGITVNGRTGHAEFVLENSKRESSTLKNFYFADGVIYLTIDYDIGGPLEIIFVPGEPVFSNMDIIDEEMAEEFEGTWISSEQKDRKIKIENGIISSIYIDKTGKDMVYDTCSIHIVRYRSSDKVAIRNADLASDFLLEYMTMDYEDGKLKTQISVLDGDPIYFTFEKIQK